MTARLDDGSLVICPDCGALIEPEMLGECCETPPPASSPRPSATTSPKGDEEREGNVTASHHMATSGRFTVASHGANGLSLTIRCGPLLGDFITPLDTTEARELSRLLSTFTERSGV